MGGVVVRCSWHHGRPCSEVIGCRVEGSFVAQQLVKLPMLTLCREHLHVMHTLNVPPLQGSTRHSMMHPT